MAILKKSIFFLKIHIGKFSKFEFFDFVDFFSKLSFFKNIFCEKKIIFLKIVFLHDEKIFFVRIFFSDQVCISSNPRNHLEPPPCPHDDSQPPTRTQFSAKIS